VPLKAFLATEHHRHLDIEWRDRPIRLHEFYLPATAAPWRIDCAAHQVMRVWGMTARSVCDGLSLSLSLFLCDSVCIFVPLSLPRGNSICIEVARIAFDAEPAFELVLPAVSKSRL
jgi:hypothetical protein